MNVAFRDFNVFQRESNLGQESVDKNTIQKKLESTAGAEKSPSWCDSQTNNYADSELNFEPNSACKKTAVFQNTKMADYKPQNTLHKNSTASLGHLNRLDQEATTPITDLQEHEELETKVDQDIELPVGSHNSMSSQHDESQQALR